MKTNQESLSFTVIEQAVHGDADAMNQILKYFEPYISKLSQKTLSDEFGNSYIHVDQEMKRSLETKLILAVMKFELC